MKRLWDWPDDRIKYCIMIERIDGAWQWRATLGACHLESDFNLATADSAIKSARRWFKKWTDCELGTSMFFISPLKD